MQEQEKEKGKFIYEVLILVALVLMLVGIFAHGIYTYKQHKAFENQTVSTEDGSSNGSETS